MMYLTERIMRFLVLILLLVYFCEADYRIKCSNSTENITSMFPSRDGVKGRYTVKWCTRKNKNDTEWNLQIFYNRRDPNKCSHRNKHSAKIEYIDKLDVNCSFVCLSTEIDLIFRACYRLENLFRSQGSKRWITTHNITNDYSMETFTSSVFTGNEINHGDYISANFFFDTIPATNYDLTLCKLNDATCIEEQTCEDATQNCTASMIPHGVMCKLRALPPATYDLRFTHLAPWTLGDFMRARTSVRRIFNVTATEDVKVASVTTGAGWLVGTGVLLVLCITAAVALAALRLRTHSLLRKHVLREWLHKENVKPPTNPVSGPILLAYAREGPVLTPFIDALKQLLDTVAPGQVYDLYDPSTTALAASSGGAWVRGMMSRSDTRLLLLQTPALQALHAATLNHSPNSEEPLLARRGVYRCPLAGDFLLPLVLRVATEHSPPAPYKQYYLATLEGLETETLPFTVPFRRYVLPMHTATLLHHLTPSEQLSEEFHMDTDRRRWTDELSRAAVDFVDHARAHPDYLLDNLMFI